VQLAQACLHALSATMRSVADSESSDVMHRACTALPVDRKPPLPQLALLSDDHGLDRPPQQGLAIRRRGGLAYQTPGSSMPMAPISSRSCAVMAVPVAFFQAA